MLPSFGWLRERFAMIIRRMNFSTAFEAALVYATTIHAGQVRRKTGMPYVAHLLGVTSIVLEHGGNEEEAIAALLHDAVEDAGGERRLQDIRERFGETVAASVMGCKDSDVFPRPPWRERKEAYLKHLPDAVASVRLVSAADKLHNARALRRILGSVGPAVWERYSGGKEGTLWYFRALVDAFASAGPAPVADELGHVVAEIEELALAKPPGH
jgi:(p)ppGpp synthase/HD superfamily hydrolase